MKPPLSLITEIESNLAEARRPPEYAVCYDIVFVVNGNSRGWILEKICKIIADASGLHTYTVYTERNDRITAPLPTARAYFFSHYVLYIAALQRERQVASAMRFVWFTHPNFDARYNAEDVAFALNHATRVFTANRHHMEMLRDLGVDSGRLRTVLGGADPAAIRGKARGAGAIGFVGAYYERKNPDLMLELIRRMPDQRFLLVGPSEDEVENRGLLWSAWARIDELRAQPNLEIVEAVYSDYPALYDRIDVFVCLSELEGGPIPLIEAMFANAVPVVTRTGFAEEVVQPGLNGHLLDLGCSVEEVEACVRVALGDRHTDIRGDAEHLSWAAFGGAIAAYMFPTVEDRKSVSFADPDICLQWLREGWGRTEARGAVLAGARGRLAVPLRPGRTLKTLELRLWIDQVPGGAPLTLSLSLDGRGIGRNTFESAGPHRWRLTLPAPLAGASDLWLELDGAGKGPLVDVLRLEQLGADYAEPQEAPNAA